MTVFERYTYIIYISIQTTQKSSSCFLMYLFTYPGELHNQPLGKKFPIQSLITSRHRSSSASILAAWHSSQIHSDVWYGFHNADFLFVEEQKVKQEIGIQLQVLESLNCKQKIFELYTNFY